MIAGRLLTRLGVGVVILWALPAIYGTQRFADARRTDPVAALEAEYGALAPALPPRGAVGFLEYAVDDDSAEHVMAYYVAQYTLAPRIVLKRADQEFVIVPRGAPRAGGDERLAGLAPVASSPGGYRLYRRRVP